MKYFPGPVQHEIKWKTLSLKLLKKPRGGKRERIGGFRYIWYTEIYTQVYEKFKLCNNMYMSGKFQDKLLKPFNNHKICLNNITMFKNIWNFQIFQHC